jgi:hypothetical protein
MCHFLGRRCHILLLICLMGDVVSGHLKLFDTTLMSIKRKPCGSELAHEDGLQSAETPADIPASTRA